MLACSSNFPVGSVAHPRCAESRFPGSFVDGSTLLFFCSRK